MFSTVVPYALLMLAVTVTGRWLRGPWGGCSRSCAWLLHRSRSPSASKVMVETFLALWILLVYSLAALYLTAPSRKIAAALGLAVALALLTKLTTALFLPGPLIYGCVRILRHRAGAAVAFRKLAIGAAVCLAVAGPWYFKNAVPAVKFAFFSSRYNEVATGSDRVPTARRAADMASDLAGWPLPAPLPRVRAGRGSSGDGRSRREVDENSDRNVLARISFTRMAWLGAGIAAAVLLFPAYFDTRFLLPIWPVLAVAIGAGLRSHGLRLPVIPKTLLGLGLAGSLLFAFSNVAREPSFATYWETTGLIDDLVDRYGVSNLMNVGNCAAWNVCKTGLMNELRQTPAIVSCCTT